MSENTNKKVDGGENRNDKHVRAMPRKHVTPVVSDSVDCLCDMVELNDLAKSGSLAIQFVGDVAATVHPIDGDHPIIGDIKRIWATGTVTIVQADLICTQF